MAYKINKVVSCYFIASILLFLFSYTQVDLGLTLSKSSIVQHIQQQFQHVGFYQRPLSTTIYLSILFVFFLLYFLVLKQIKNNTLVKRDIWMVVAVLCVVLLFSYSAAFSYDIYNYIFTAKTVLIYGQNPYTLKPLQLEGIDSMLSFMRWTHLPSAYTPLWIALTLPAYLLSFGSLLLGIWTMKLIPILSYVITIWSISQVMNYYKKSLVLLSVGAFALNPLVIIEVLVSGHNDILMMALSMIAFLLALQKKRVSSFFLLSLSIATKFITIFLWPLWFIGWSRVKAIILVTIGLVIVLLRREFLQWYFLWILPFGVLFPENIILMNLLAGISMGLLLRYTPIFYYGSYDPPVPSLQNLLFFIPILASIIYSVAILYRKKPHRWFLP